MKLKILAILALAAVGVGAAFVAMGGLPASAASKTQYLTGAATTGDISDDVAATGTVASTAAYGVSFGSPAHLAAATTSTSSSTSSASGSTTWTVTSLKVKVGDAVKKGQLLATADATDLKRQLTDATNAVTTAKLQRATAKDNLAAATTTAATRTARIAYNNSETQVSNAQKAKTDLEAQINLANLTAPIDGIATAVNVTAGLAAPSGDAIVIAAGSFQVTANVVESDLAAMAVGQAASVSIGAVDAIVPGRSRRSPRPRPAARPAAS